LSSVRAFAPATIGNVACGFDVFGLALESPGDEVLARRRSEPGVGMSRITGDKRRLPMDSDRNTASVAAQALLTRVGSQEGVELELFKGLPLGSGLGSSAASAVAAVVAVNRLLELGASDEDLLVASAEGERVACGSAHLDNVAPALFGGFVMVAAGDAPRPVKIPTPKELRCALVRPHVEVPTAEARAVLGDTVTLENATRQWTNTATLVAGLFLEDWDLVERSLVDVVAEPKRADLVPGFRAVQSAALAVGALGCSISGAGPTIFALCRGEANALEVVSAMSDALTGAGCEGDSMLSGVGTGARIVEVSR
jgi:homoserine kinase